MCGADLLGPGGDAHTTADERHPVDDETLLATTDEEAGERVSGSMVEAPVEPDLPGEAAVPDAPARRSSSRIPRLPALPALAVPRLKLVRTAAVPSDTGADPSTTTADGEPDDATDAAPSGTTSERTTSERTVSEGTSTSAGKPGDVLAGWVSRALDAYPRPALPLATRWDASVAGLVRQVPHMPRFATRPLELLDRFGAVHVGPEGMGFDGDEIAWDRVLEVRTAPAWSSLSADALEANFAQYLRVIPRLPGRGWVLGKVSELLVSLYLAVVPLPDDAALLLAPDATGEDPEGETPESETPRGDAAPALPRVPFTERTVTEIVYKKRFGEGEQQASTTSVLLQLAFPESTEAMLALAAERDVTVVHVPVEDGEMGAAIRRAASWRGAALGMRDRFVR